MEQYFATTFEDVRHERSLILLLSLLEPDTLKQSKFTGDEIEIIKKYYSREIVKTTHSERDYCFAFVRKTIF